MDARLAYYETEASSERLPEEGEGKFVSLESHDADCSLSVLYSLFVLVFSQLAALVSSYPSVKVLSQAKRNVLSSSLHPHLLLMCDTSVILSVLQRGQNTLGPLTMLTHQVWCLCSVSLNRQPISGPKLDLLSFLNFPEGRVILLSNKHDCKSLSSRRVAQILESNCLQTLKY